MTKLNSGKTIIIKINGEKRPFSEVPSKVEEQPSTENQPKASEADSTQTENEAVVETAASQELTEDGFDWILPEQDENEIKNELSLYKSAKATKQRKGIRLPALSNVDKKNLGQLKPILLSVFFAVLLGTSFGLLMLKLVITDNGKPAANHVPAAAVSAPKKSSPITDSNSQAAATFQPLKTYMVQGGAFTKKEAAQQMAGQTIKKGIPAETLELNGKYYLFIGTADSLENARNLGNLYQDKGMSGVFSKTLTIPEKKLSNLTLSEKGFVENALELVPLLANLSSKTRVGATLPSSGLKSLSALETKLTKINSKEIKNKKIIDLKLEITGAIKQVNEYQQKKDHKALANVQQHLLTFLAVYYSL